MDISKGILKAGDRKCRHIEEIANDSKTMHLIGECSKCGRKLDYSLLQNELLEMHDGYTDPKFKMNQLIKTATGNTKILNARRIGKVKK